MCSLIPIVNQKSERGFCEFDELVWNSEWSEDTVLRSPVLVVGSYCTMQSKLSEYCISV